MCPAKEHFISHIVDYVGELFSLPDTNVDPSILVRAVVLSFLLSILVCAAASLFCACLVSVHVSVSYVIAGVRSCMHVSSGRRQGFF